MVAEIQRVLVPEDLNDTDRAILDELRNGRVTPKFLSERVDVSRTYASERLRRLREHGHVERVAGGLYELREDPRREKRKYEKLGQENLEWEKLGPTVTPGYCDRLDYVIETLEKADKLAGDFDWSTRVAVVDGQEQLTIEELLGALGEAKHLRNSYEDDIDGSCV